MSAVANELYASRDELSPARARIQVVRELADLDRLAGDWHALESYATQPTQHFAWARAAAEAFRAHGQLHVVTIWESETCVAIAALTRTVDWPRLESLSVDALFEPVDFLVRDPAALAALADALAHQGLPLLLGRVPGESPTALALKRAFAWTRVAEGAPYPYIDLGPSWTEQAQFNSGRRSDFRRAARHASSYGQVTYQILTPTMDEVPALLDEAFAVEASSWKGDEGSALACDVTRAAFFRSYAMGASRDGSLRIAFMRIAGKAVAMQIAVECHDRFWLLKIGYDATYAKASPGALLMLHTLADAHERGLVSYEFLGGAAPWTTGWTRQLRASQVIRAYPISVSGAVVLGRDAAHWALARARRRMERDAVRP